MKKTTILLIAMTTILYVSCGKNKYKPDMDSIVGTYQGTISYDLDNSSEDATTEITSSGEYSVNVHCHSNNFDTTFVMDIFQDGNVVFCNNGNYNDKSSHMAKMHQHCNTEEHHGYFDTDKKSFTYSFERNANNADFDGIKK